MGYRRDFRMPGDGPRGGPDEVEEELRFYLDERARELEAGGLPPDEARRVARERFGDPERVADEVARIDDGRRRDERRRAMIDGLARDVKLAVRGLARRPLFSGVVVATLGLGIGAVTAVFSVVNASLVRSLPFEDADRLVFLQGAFNAPEGPQVRGASPPEARDWEAMSRSFDGVAAFDGVGLTLGGADGPAERVSGEAVDDGYFDLLRVRPVAGRTLNEGDHRSGASVAVLGEGLWTRSFGRDPGVVGRDVTLNGFPYTVVGVVPEGFSGMTLASELWLPLAAVAGEEGMADRGSRYLGAVARLRPGTSLEEARADMDAVGARLQEAHPRLNLDRIALVTPIREVFLGSSRALLLVLMGATALLLVIAAANVANLVLVRSWARGGETLLRRALGAGRGVLLRQFLAEGLVLSAAGAALGLLLGLWGARALAGATPDALLPPYVDVRPDVLVFGAVAALMAAVGIATGLVPALAAGGGDLARGLRERGAGGRGAGRSRFQGLLVAGEVALALLLLVGAGLMVRSLRAQLAVEPGFDHERLLSFTVGLPSARYEDRDARRVGMDELASRLAAIPGVTGVTYGPDAAPLRGGSSATYLRTERGAEGIRFYIHQVQPGWFETMGVDVRSGRPLSPADADGGLTAAVIGRAMAERHFGGEDPVGRSIFLGGGDGLELTIVGVAGDVRYRDLVTDLVSGPTDPDVYIPWTASSGNLEVLLRTDGDPGALSAEVRRVVRGFDPDVPVANLSPMADVLRVQTAQGRFGSLLLGAFSVLAAFLAAVGLYGVLSFTVGRRTREIAVRMAMGADGGAVRRMVVVDGLRLAAAGLVVGAAAAALAARTLDAFLFDVDPVDAPTYLAVAGLMAAVAALAAWIPALRATRIEPQRALAGE